MKHILIILLFSILWLIPTCNDRKSESQYTGPVLNDLLISKFDTNSIALARPAFQTTGGSDPTVCAYIGIRKIITLTGTDVSGAIEGPIDVSSGEYCFNGLDVCTDYTIIVVAENAYGFSTKQLTSKTASTGTVQWARSASSGAADSGFSSIAVDSNDNIYAAGYITGNGYFIFGGYTIHGASSGSNIVLVKYNTAGEVLWANTVDSASGGSSFSSIAVDSNDNIYAAGYITGNGYFTFGGCTIHGSYNGSNILLVKYNTAGEVLWAKTVDSAPSFCDSAFISVAVDTAGNVYAAGCIHTLMGEYTEYNFGDNILISERGTLWFNYRILLLKYNTSGIALWAKTVKCDGGASEFYSIAVDSTGSVYAAGYIKGKDMMTDTFDFGNNIAVTSYFQNDKPVSNSILVKYDTSGITQWAIANRSGTISNSYYSIASIGGNCFYASEGGLLTKHNLAGAILWTKKARSFNSLAVDTSDNVYGATHITGNIVATSGYDLGDGVIINEPGAFNTGNNILLANYNSSGLVQCGKTVTIGPSESSYSGVAIGSEGIYACGSIKSTGMFNFGNGQTVAGATSGYNVLLVKYR